MAPISCSLPIFERPGMPRLRHLRRETVLPVIALSAYGLASSTGALLLIIAPLLVVTGQMRLTRATANVDAAARLAAAMLLMGLPFLALIGRSGVVVIAAVIVVFVVGEMLWSRPRRRSSPSSRRRRGAVPTSARWRQ
jgi:hypothetical protein